MDRIRWSRHSDVIYVGHYNDVWVGTISYSMQFSDCPWLLYLRDVKVKEPWFNSISQAKQKAEEILAKENGL